MATLDARKRRELPDRAFAYVDSTGRRRLPINDEAHVRNALARFDQVHFEDEAARDRARGRLLRAAKRHGIVPVGFITGQLSPGGQRRLPTGVVTFLMADIEASTALLARVGDRYGPLLLDVRRLTRRSIRRVGGHEVDARGDEYLAAFAHAPDAVDAALDIHDRLADRAWPDGETVRVRIGLHTGRPTRTETGYVGLAVHAVARISAIGRGGQTILSRSVVAGLGTSRPAGVTLVELGPRKLRGIPGREVLYLIEPTTSQVVTAPGGGRPARSRRTIRR
jgi:class 3 adenylate cyclase